MKRVIEPAYAKINLLLQIVGKRQDGYHLLDGVMQTVSLADTVTVELEPSAGRQIFLTAVGNDAMPTDERNLAFRAADAFLHTIGSGGQVRIHIEKRIPMAGGLAGGSTDAAATLRALNQLSGLPLSGKELCKIGQTLGADVPFCIRGGTMRTRGVGDRLTPCVGLPPCYLVIACAGEGVSTPLAYAELDRRYGDFKDAVPGDRKVEKLIDAMQKGDLTAVCDGMENLFEPVIRLRNPYVEIIGNTLKNSGAAGAMMSGSGPSVFGIFASEETARRGRDALEKIGVPGAVCTPVNREFSIC